MRRFSIITLLVGLLVSFLAASVLKTLKLEGVGVGGVSSSDLLDLGTLNHLNLQTVSIGGTVIKLQPTAVWVLNKEHQVLQIQFGRGAQFAERGAVVTSAAIEIGAHLTVRALRPRSDTYVAYKVLISPHRQAIGGTIVNNRGVLTIVSRHGTISIVRLQPSTVILHAGQQQHEPLALHTQVQVQAYVDPAIQGVFVADTVHVLNKASNQRPGGVITHIDTVRNTITIHNQTENRTYTIEVIPATIVTLKGQPSGYADMRVGDHITAIGKADPARTRLGPNPTVARFIRVSPPSFAGSITAIASKPGGAVSLTVRGHHGHLLAIDAPGQTQVYLTSIQGQQTAHVLDLLVGEHISARGSSTGKFTLLASAIHVYPHQRTVGGIVLSSLPGRVRIRAADGSQFIIHLTAATVVTLNGTAATGKDVQLGLHIRAHGYDALHSDQRRVPTLIATQISVLARHRTTNGRTVTAGGAAPFVILTPTTDTSPSPPDAATGAA